jgi:protein ImuB
MLWSCIYLPRLPWDARPEAGAPGARAPEAERAALEGVAAWACRYTDRLIVERRETARGPFCAVLAEVSGSLALFGGLPRLDVHMRTAFAQLEYAHAIAHAPTPAAAEVLARAGDAEPLTARDAIVARLAPLPLALLDLPEPVLAALHGVGLRTIGECLRLPHDALARRFGEGCVSYLRRLLGNAPDPRPLYVPPAGYQRRFEFAGALDTVEQLLFPLKRLLLELEGVLVGRDCAVLRLALELAHEDAPATVVPLALGAPRRDAAGLLELARERLDRVQAPPATALTLRVEEFAAAPYAQHDLFDERVRREACLRNLVERLAARLGADAVRSLVLREDHRPERSFTEKKGSDHFPPAALRKNDLTLFPAERPLWLLPEPRLLRAPPPRLSRPERIETGWWDGQGVARDYYVAQTRGGSRLWVFCQQGQWFLHGVWA